MAASRFRTCFRLIRSDDLGQRLSHLRAAQHPTARESAARIDASLDVGDASTKIEVTADAAQLNYDNGVKQEGVPPQVVNQLPLLVAAGTPRNAVQFISFLPGVNTGTSPQAFNARINGGLKMGDEAVMDGVSMQEGTMSQSGMVSFFDFPTTPDMVSEVQVLTSSYEPEYGTTTGGEIIVTTRSGTDQFHGRVFEYFRNKDLNALQFTNQRAPATSGPRTTKTSTAASLAVPSRFHSCLSFGERNTRPTSSMMKSICAASAAPPALWSPFLRLRSAPATSPTWEFRSTIQRPESSSTASSFALPFPGNQIPASEQSPLALQWMNYLANPTSPGPYNNYLCHAGLRWHSLERQSLPV